MKTKQYQKAWRYLELPDILGRMRPTSVADPSTDPGRIIEEDKIIQVEDDEEIQKQSIPEKPENKYRVINDDDIV